MRRVTFDTDGESVFSSKFKKVFKEMKAIEKKIHKTKGWIFKIHIYSQDELFDSEHFDKIFAITEKIGDDAQRWYDEGNLDKEEQRYYSINREKVEDTLEDINDEIANREPTWWEKFKENMQEFATKVMRNLPKLKRVLLTIAKKLEQLPGPFKVIGKVLKGIEKGRKMLSR